MPNKVQSYERRKLEEDDTLITNQEEVAMNLTNFFLNAVLILKFEKFEDLILSQKAQTTLIIEDR